MSVLHCIAYLIPATPYHLHHTRHRKQTKALSDVGSSLSGSRRPSHVASPGRKETKKMTVAANKKMIEEAKSSGRGKKEDEGKIEKLEKAKKIAEEEVKRLKGELKKMDSEAEGRIKLYQDSFGVLKVCVRVFVGVYVCVLVYLCAYVCVSVRCIWPNIVLHFP